MDVWENQDFITINIYDICQRITNIFKQCWYADIQNSRRLLYYSIYKHDFQFEQYLNVISVKKFRIAFTRFRLSSHDLAVQNGRYTYIQTNDRLCRQCNMQVIENEYHFLLVCPKYSVIRQLYFKPYFNRWPTINKFEALMTTTSIKTMCNLSKYVYFALQLRQG